MYITKQQYLDNANRNLKEWFIDNTYDFIFIPLIARDYLTAYLMKYEKIGRTSPDMDWVLSELLKYDEKATDRFSPLNIKLKEDIKDIDFYLNLLYECKEYVEGELC